VKNAQKFAGTAKNEIRLLGLSDPILDQKHLTITIILAISTLSKQRVKNRSKILVRTADTEKIMQSTELKQWIITEIQWNKNKAADIARNRADSMCEIIQKSNTEKELKA